MASPLSQQPMGFSFSNALVTGGTFVQHIQGNPEPGFQNLKNFVAPGAFHNSGERFDPPKCYPNTRVAVLKKIMDWVMGQDPDTRDALIMWLHGAAGAGKSAIAQSIAEQCYTEGRLLASFFFGRSDPHRNNAKALFATLAYQIGLAYPGARQTLDDILRHDPLITTRSLFAQFQALIANPIRSILGSEDLASFLIVIDGLDECLDREMQCQILDVIIKGVREHQLPLIFLIASRPEPEISNRLSAPDATEALTRLLLDYTYRPREDIELFLRDKFKKVTETHPFKDFIPPAWPEADVLASIVDKSSGQFIYASTVVKYVESTRHKPHQRLEIIRQIRPSKDRPFAELDALYSQILSGVEDLEEVLRILGFRLMHPFTFFESKDLEDVFGFEPGDILMLLSALPSVVDIQSVDFHHASLADFLLDKSRSGAFHIDITIDRTDNVRKCIQYLTRHAQPGTYQAQTGGGAFLLAMEFFDTNYKHVSYTSSLKEDAMRLSVSRSGRSSPRLLKARFMTQFLPHFFEFLKDATWSNAESVYSHHLSDFDELFQEMQQACFADIRLTCALGLIPYYLQQKEDLHTLRILPLPFAPDPKIWAIDEQHLHLVRWSEFDRVEYLQFLHDFMLHPRRSEQYALDADKYARAAYCCLAFICDEESLPPTSPIPPRLRYYEGSILADPPEIMAKHDLTALWGINNFLIKAGRLSELVELCISATISKASKNHPEECEAAKNAIAAYLKKMDC